MRPTHPAITRAGTPVLHRLTTPVDRFDDALLALFAQMERICREANGAGLAAPQIGVGLAAAIVTPDGAPFAIDLVNPRIVGAGGSQTGPEGCLSVDGAFDGMTTRPEGVIVEAADRHGQLRRFEAHGFIARACCHEIDHLGGFVFTDRRPDPLDGLLRRVVRLR
jgi:peptide deformylase